MSLTNLYRATLAAVLFAAIPIASVTAIATTPSPTGLTTVQAQHLANLKTKGTAEIDRRLANLNAALQALGSSTKLQASDKDALTKQINDEISGLTALKTKLTADTDLATARTDVASIVSDYRVYALMLPKARMVASADRFAMVEDKLTALHDKLATKVSARNSSASSGISADELKLQDMATKIADAKAKAGSLVSQLLALQPTDYNANHAVLVNYRTSMKTAHDDLKAARDDAKAVIDDLKAAK